MMANAADVDVESEPARECEGEGDQARLDHERLLDNEWLTSQPSSQAVEGKVTPVGEKVYQASLNNEQGKLAGGAATNHQASLRGGEHIRGWSKRKLNRVEAFLRPDA